MESQPTSSENETREPGVSLEDKSGETLPKRPERSNKKTYLQPTPGYIPNPLYSGAIRNEKCTCGSGKKVKKCCGVDAFIKDPRRVYKSEVPLETIARMVEKAKATKEQV